MRFAVSPSFDLNTEEKAQLKDVVREVFQTKPRGRRSGEVRRATTKKPKSVSLF